MSQIIITSGFQNQSVDLVSEETAKRMCEKFVRLNIPFTREEV